MCRVSSSGKVFAGSKSSTWFSAKSTCWPEKRSNSLCVKIFTTAQVSKETSWVWRVLPTRAVVMFQPSRSTTFSRARPSSWDFSATAERTMSLASWLAS